MLDPGRHHDHEPLEEPVVGQVRDELPDLRGLDMANRDSRPVLDERLAAHHAIDSPGAAVIEGKHVRPASIDCAGLLVALVCAEDRGQLIGPQQDLAPDLQKVAQHLGREVVGGQPNLYRLLGLLAAVLLVQRLPFCELNGKGRHLFLVLITQLLLYLKYAAHSRAKTVGLLAAALGDDGNPDRRVLRPTLVLDLKLHAPIVGQDRRACTDRQRRDMAWIDLQAGALGDGELVDRGRQAGLVDRCHPR